MGFIRFLLLVLVGVILWRLIQNQIQNAQLQEPKPESIPPTSPSTTNGIMVRCNYCGLHLPENEALHVGQVWYCCEVHQHASKNE